jgi:hypothetical protein
MEWQPRQELEPHWALVLPWQEMVLQEPPAALKL